MRIASVHAASAHNRNGGRRIHEIAELVEAGNVVKFRWCGDEAIGKDIEEKTGYDILGIQEEISEGKCIASDNDAKYMALIAKTY